MPQKTPMPTDEAILVEFAKLNCTMQDVLTVLREMKGSLDKIANRKP
jgi:hypothetical protein